MLHLRLVPDEEIHFTNRITGDVIVIIGGGMRAKRLFITAPKNIEIQRHPKGTYANANNVAKPKRSVKLSNGTTHPTNGTAPTN